MARNRKPEKPPPGQSTPSELNKKKNFSWQPLVTTAAAAAITTGALVYTSMQNTPSPPPRSPDPYYPDPSAAQWLTSDEAIDIYLSLERQVVAKQAEANQKGKKLRIFVLEKHGSKNAMAYAIMLLDIAKKHGIGILALEQNIPDYQESLNDPIDWRYVYKAPWQVIMQRAKKDGIVMQPVDTLFSDIPAQNAVWDRTTESLATPRLEAYLHMQGLGIQVTADPDPSSTEFNYRITGLTAPLQPFQESETKRILHSARAEAFGQMRNQRNVHMVKQLKQIGNAMALNGKNHAKGILEPLRESGDLDITFSIYHSKDKRDDNEHLRSNVSERDKELLRWANDPANAVVCEGKDFPDQNLPIFIERAIEKANQKTRGRP